ncbi:MAG: hypothetical protein UV80_C0001G0061 [Candidatus Peregrinibacteria bacterium GW2011_GWF2_43_17]|nr:MAG: hypothetical protein UV80_C0001G0061 [Candidatus Peregrinibacteria bacterium GW2011_GWF2_43_17]KKT20492.1 MAG: hypothetical protein UW03_C0003G0028 [Candidatus Peregrinibacteria bacterium GW2011_GWA2_43_8]HAU40303.1 hypothetical protein [Candidatus Peregrinibacteria bacterium]
MIKKFVLTILAITTLLIAQTNIAMAEESTTDTGIDSGASGSDTDPTPDTPTYDSLGSFDVGELLTTEGQEQGYLDDEDQAPILGFILDVIDFLIKVIGTFCMILIIIGGLLMLSSQGDDSKVQKGKAIITQAIIGLILSLTSYILVTFVQSLLYVQS